MNSDFSAPIILENENVLLRPLEINDYDHLLPFSLYEPELWTNFPGRQANNKGNANGEESLKNYIKVALEDREAKKDYPFIVFDKRKNKYAGSTRFYDINLPYKSLHLGFTWYGKEFQGTGLNKNCKYLLLKFAFEDLGLERVQFGSYNENKKSVAAMKSIGCVVEGVLRSTVVSPDGKGRSDSIILSILRKEWFETVRTNLESKVFFEPQ